MHPDIIHAVIKGDADKVNQHLQSLDQSICLDTVFEFRDPFAHPCLTTLLELATHYHAYDCWQASLTTLKTLLRWGANPLHIIPPGRTVLAATPPEKLIILLNAAKSQHGKEALIHFLNTQELTKHALQQDLLTNYEILVGFGAKPFTQEILSIT